jgi:hypothetical protein
MEISRYKALRVAATVSLSITAAIVFDSQAFAQTCEQGCGLQSRACSADALPTMLDCKLGCRQTTDPVDLGACMRGCMDSFAGSREACRSDVDACEDSCEPEGDDGSGEEPPEELGQCTDDCGQTLGGCAIEVKTASKSCVELCRAGTQKRACFRECAAFARDSAKECASDFRMCMRDCGAPPPIVHCQNAEAPTCGGICRFMTQTCAEIEEGQCGCVRDD